MNITAFEVAHIFCGIKNNTMINMNILYKSRPRWLYLNNALYKILDDGINDKPWNF